jgi:hypothetical protein
VVLFILAFLPYGAVQAEPPYDDFDTADTFDTPADVGDEDSNATDSFLDTTPVDLDPSGDMLPWDMTMCGVYAAAFKANFASLRPLNQLIYDLKTEFLAAIHRGDGFGDDHITALRLRIERLEEQRDSLEQSQDELIEKMQELGCAVLPEDLICDSVYQEWLQINQDIATADARIAMLTDRILILIRDFGRSDPRVVASQSELFAQILAIGNLRRQRVDIVNDGLEKGCQFAEDILEEARTLSEGP